MRIDLIDVGLARRLRGLEDEVGAAPYDWAEFQRRRDPRIAARRALARRRSAVAVVMAALVIAALGGYFGSMALHRPVARPTDRPTLARASRCPSGERQQASDAGCTGAPRADSVQARIPAGQGALAGLSNGPVVLRLGTQVAESGLVNQIATLDEVLSAARVSGTRPARLAILERRRRQLVSALSEVRYAEMLADASNEP